MSLYDKTLWRNDNTPDIDAEHLNKLEGGVYDAHIELAAADGKADQAKVDAAAAMAALVAHAARIDNPHHVTAEQVGATGGSGGGLGINAATRGAKGDDATDNTNVLQSLLDEIRVAGGGSLLVPRAGGGIYRTRNLYVPGGCQIISDGATLKSIGRSAVVRASSLDGDNWWATGLLSVYPQNLIGVTACPENVLIQGLILDVSSARTDGGATYGIDIAGRHVKVYGCQVIGDAKDCINIGSRRLHNLWHIHVRDSWLTGARRNIISIEGADIRYVWIEGCRIYGCAGIAAPVGYDGASDNSPGAGIDVEQPSSGAGNLAHIFILNNYIGSNAGPGIWLNFNNQPSGGGDTLEGIVISGNRVDGNCTASLGGGLGNIDLKGGRPDQSVRIVNNLIQDSRAGAGIQGSPYDTSYWRQATLIANNRLSGNAAGSISIPGGIASVTQSGNF